MCIHNDAMRCYIYTLQRGGGVKSFIVGLYLNFHRILNVWPGNIHLIRKHSHR